MFVKSPAAWSVQDFQPLFILSVKYFTIDHGSEVCTLLSTEIGFFYIILSVLY